MDRLNRGEYWLSNRLKANNSQFSFTGTCNWIGAIALLCKQDSFSKSKLSEFYTSTQRRTVNIAADTLVFEQAFYSFQYLSALEAMKINKQYHYNFIHSAIISWYYGVYFSAGAMIAACDGSNQQDHKGTANAWTNHLVVPQKIVYPFDLSLRTMVKKEYEIEIDKLRKGDIFPVQQPSIDENSAHSHCVSFLRGTADWYRKDNEEKILNNGKLKEFTDFRKKEAQIKRDEHLKKKKISFLHQASRLRGKANYRDAIYLSYGKNHEQEITNLINDLHFTLHCFLQMASHYCSRRVEQGTWSRFCKDVDCNKLVLTSIESLKV